MKIVKSFPPNIETIRAILEPTPDAVYAYGDTIYNPSGKELSPDIILHENIHSKQQGINPEGWWAQYLADCNFRFKEELEAYGHQYAFAQEHVRNKKLLEWAKESMALALSSEAYGRLCTYGEAESKIRNYAQ